MEVISGFGLAFAKHLIDTHIGPVSKGARELLNKLIKKILCIDEEKLVRASMARTYPIVCSILENLNCSDLKSCSRVCRSWNTISTNMMKEKILYTTLSEGEVVSGSKFLVPKEAVKMLETHSIQLILIFQLNKITVYNYTDNKEDIETPARTEVRLKGVRYSKHIAWSAFQTANDKGFDTIDLPPDSVITFPFLPGLKIIPLSASRKKWRQYRKSGLNIFEYLEIPVKDLKCLLFFVNARHMFRIHSKMNLSYTTDCAIGGGVMKDIPSDFLGLAFCGPKVHAYSFGWTTNKKHSTSLAKKPSGINTSNCVGMIFLNTSTFDWKNSERDLKEFVQKEFPHIHFSIFYENYTFWPYSIGRELLRLKLKCWFALVTLIWID